MCDFLLWKSQFYDKHYNFCEIWNFIKKRFYNNTIFYIQPFKSVIIQEKLQILAQKL